MFNKQFFYLFYWSIDCKGLFSIMYKRLMSWFVPLIRTSYESPWAHVKCIECELKKRCLMWDLNPGQSKRWEKTSALRGCSNPTLWLLLLLCKLNTYSQWWWKLWWHIHTHKHTLYKVKIFVIFFGFAFNSEINYKVYQVNIWKFFLILGSFLLEWIKGKIMFCFWFWGIIIF